MPKFSNASFACAPPAYISWQASIRGIRPSSASTGKLSNAAASFNLGMPKVVPLPRGIQESTTRWMAVTSCIKRAAPSVLKSCRSKTSLYSKFSRLSSDSRQTRLNGAMPRVFWRNSKLCCKFCSQVRTELAGGWRLGFQRTRNG